MTKRDLFEMLEEIDDDAEIRIMSTIAVLGHLNRIEVVNLKLDGVYNENKIAFFRCEIK